MHKGCKHFIVLKYSFLHVSLAFISQYDVFLDEEVDEKFKFGQKVIGEVRSAKAKYDIPHKTKIECKLTTEFNSDASVLIGGIFTGSDLSCKKLEFSVKTEKGLLNMCSQVRNFYANLFKM